MELLLTAKLACLLIIFWNEIRSNEAKSTTIATDTVPTTSPALAMMYTCQYNFKCNLSVYFQTAGDLGTCDSVVPNTVNMGQRPMVAWNNPPMQKDETYWLVMVSPDIPKSCNPSAMYLPIAFLWAVKATFTFTTKAFTLAATDASSYSAPTQNEEDERRYQLLLYPMKTTSNENPFLNVKATANMSEILTVLNLAAAQAPDATYQFRVKKTTTPMPKSTVPTVETTTMPMVKKDTGAPMSTTNKMLPTVPKQKATSSSTCLKPTVPGSLMAVIGFVLTMVLA